MPTMQVSPQEEILELLQRYTAFLADSTKSDSARFEAAKYWEKKFERELQKIKRREQSGTVVGVHKQRSWGKNSS